MSILHIEADFLEHFSNFDLETWQKWLEAWLHGNEAEPRIKIHDGNLLEGLVSLYRALSESPVRLAFGDAAAMLLNATLIDDSSSLRLSTLVGLVSYATPTSGRAVIRKLLNMDPTWFIGERLSSIYLQILNAAGRYGLDDWLWRYVTAQRPGATLQQNLACFRILSQNMRDRDAAVVLDRIIPQMGNKAEESALKIELIHASGLLGCAGLLRYAIDRQLEFKYDEDWSGAGDHFSNAMVGALRRHLTPQDIVKLLSSWPHNATDVLVSFMTELHMVKLLNGSSLWTLEYFDDDQFAISVRGMLYKLSTTSHSQVLAILQAAMKSSEYCSQSDLPEFDIHASNLRYDEFRKRIAA